MSEMGTDLNGPILGAIVMGVVLLGLVFLIVLGARSKPPGTMTRPASLDRAALHDPEIQDFMARDMKIQAIKRYRELTGVGLKEAKDAVEYGFVNRDVLTTGSAWDTVPSARPDRNTASDPELLDYIRRDLKIQAIKRYRELTGLGLKEAKDAVDALYADPGALLMNPAKPAAEPPTAAPPDDGVRKLVREGKLIEASKLYREFTGVSFTEADEAIRQIQQEIGSESQ